MTSEEFKTLVCNSPGQLTLIGKGFNKKCYKIPSNNEWLVLCATETKKNVLEEEFQQLNHLKTCKIAVPALGDCIFPIQIGDIQYYAFVEQFIEGFEIERTGTAFTESNINDFGQKIVDQICACGNFSNAKAMYNYAMSNLQMLETAFHDDNFQIPDMQLRFSNTDGIIYVLDPGAVGSSENAHDKQKRWIQLLLKSLDSRDMNRFWKKQHGEAVNF